MRTFTLPVLATLVIAGFGASNLPAAASETDASRWAIIGKAYAQVDTLISGADGGNRAELLIALENAVAGSQAECNTLVKYERASCLDALLRLKTLATASIDPDRPKQNKRFPTNIPDFVSPEMTKVMENWVPYWLADNFTTLPDPDDMEAWQYEVLHGEVIGPAAEAGKALLSQLNVTTEEREIGGVRTVIVKPQEIRHPGKVLIHAHGGAFYANTPETTFDRTAPLSNMMGIDIVSVDYKLMPAPGWDILDQRDQLIAVFDALTGEDGEYAPEDVGMYGCSAGSGLTAMAVNALSHRGGTAPAAVVIQGAMTDFTFDSDSFTTLRYDDPRTNVDLLIEYTWPMLGMDGEKAYDPRYSTVLDNFEGRDFPPTMVQVGSKEIQMSDGIRLYGVLRSAGHEVELDVHDAMQHCFHGHWGTPEAAEAVRRVAEFFEKHLSAK